MMPPTSARTANPATAATKTGTPTEEEEEEGGCGIVPKTVG